MDEAKNRPDHLESALLGNTREHCQSDYLVSPKVSWQDLENGGNGGFFSGVWLILALIEVIFKHEYRWNNLFPRKISRGIRKNWSQEAVGTASVRKHKIIGRKQDFFYYLWSNLHQNKSFPWTKLSEIPITHVKKCKESEKIGPKKLWGQQM